MRRVRVDSYTSYIAVSINWRSLILDEPYYLGSIYINWPLTFENSQLSLRGSAGALNRMSPSLLVLHGSFCCSKVRGCCGTMPRNEFKALGRGAGFKFTTDGHVFLSPGHVSGSMYA